MPQSVIEAMMNFCNMGNPSSSYESASCCKNLIRDFKIAISRRCGFSLADYRIIFTSGASESNSMILRSIADSYGFKKKTIPHIISSEIEHKSILLGLEELSGYGKIEFTLLGVDLEGRVNISELTSAIKPNTALITIMAANNELGTINNIRSMGEIAHRYGIPFHTDCVQLFGKNIINPDKDNVDAFSVSFHKLFGPPGVGILVVKEALVKGYDLKSMIFGTQNNFLRGGTENMPGISGAYMCFRVNFNKRQDKNNHLVVLRMRLMKKLAENFKCSMYKTYMTRRQSQDRQEQPKKEIVIISPIKGCINSVALFAYIDRQHPEVCNSIIKKYMEKNGIIISVGSACNTSSAKASHVLTALRAPTEIKRGVIRVSWCDYTTVEDIEAFVSALVVLSSTKIPIPTKTSAPLPKKK